MTITAVEVDLGGSWQERLREVLEALAMCDTRDSPINAIAESYHEVDLNFFRLEEFTVAFPAFRQAWSGSHKDASHLVVLIHKFCDAFLHHYGVAVAHGMHTSAAARGEAIRVY